MARISIPDGDDIERARLWKLVPELAKGVSMTGKALYAKVSLDVRVREIARMRVAQINQCHI